jgi:hypothetical protein
MEEIKNEILSSIESINEKLKKATDLSDSELETLLLTSLLQEDKS